MRPPSQWSVRSARAFGYAVAAATGLASIALMGTAGWLLASAWQQPPILHLQIAIVGVRAFAIGRAALRYLERLVSHDAAFRDLTRERVALIDRLRPVLPAGAGARSSQLLARVVADVDRLQDRPLRGVGPLVTAAACAVVTVAVVAWIDLAVGAALLVALVASGAAATWLAVRVAARAEREVAPLAAELDATLLEALRARDLLVAFDAWDAQAARILALERRLGERSRRLAIAAGAGSAVVVAAGGLAVAAAVALLAGDAGALAPGLVGLAALVPLALFEVWGAVPAAALVLRESRVRRARVDAVAQVDGVPAETGDGTPPSGALRLVGVTAAWPGASCAFAPVDLVAEPGDVVAVRGASGVGKSTLAAALVRFLEHEGEATVGGVDLRTLHPEAVRTSIVLVEQLPHLLDTSVRENLRFARDGATDDDLWSALEDVGLAEWARSRDGLDTMPGDRAALVSGGQAQRLALARALLAAPPILVLDEPTANVDDEVALPLMRRMLEAARASGRIVVVTSHTPVPDDLVTRTVTLQPALRT
ncbi:thiol reductant ABC exporter subunit CydC [Agrococcus sp. SGAir0287]|uniref:thiol reductant ABC exporter subunit CydC n=1 Tax=Agrococcus sp. SGAir0287 TaxID=2070347 RepID=UPI0010CD5B67|nr:thiol reductant ABC exporter subunit CydC [Agrococcus sp. SGAir0287]QCR19466.1 thiol reductant ABC exporter subunit CydC [Agrococcus sp. SGAir0287]